MWGRVLADSGLNNHRIVSLIQPSDSKHLEQYEQPISDMFLRAHEMNIDGIFISIF
jgi:hypothetical protein